MRAVRLEGEFITSILNPPRHEKDPTGDLDLQIHGAVLDPGIPATIGAGAVQQLVGVFQRYESCFAHRLLQVLHELERLQRMRQGERVPAPAAADLSVHADAGTLDSTPAALEQPKAPSGDGESLRAPVTLDVNAQADAGTFDSTSAAVEPAKALLSDGERLPAPITVDVNGRADAGTLDSAHASLEQPKARSGDAESVRAPVTVDVNGNAKTEALDSAPAESEHSPVLAAADVVGGETPVRDSTPVAWGPRPPSRPLWNKR